jgi:hypothetical protein
LKISESEFGTAVALIPLMFNGKEKKTNGNCRVPVLFT